MSKTLLAVDDSATMRKVFEITFSGEDFNVVTADSRASAISKLDEGPSVVLVDATLGSDDGYSLCEEVRKANKNAVVILLGSKQNPPDPSRAQSLGADDVLEKPFDTQTAIDKVRKAMLAREGGGAKASVAPAAPAPAIRTTETAPSMPSPIAAAPAAPAPAARPAASAPAAASAASAASSPSPTTKAASTPMQTSSASSVASAVNGNMAGRLAELGLTPTQVDGVLALSRETVERVVWEVVPQLAEALIKEEIARLMR